MFAYCVSAAVSRSRFRGASQAPALRVTSSAHGCGRRTYTSRSRLRSFNRCAARLAPRAERSAWSWTSTLEIRPDLENDEIADWRRRGHRDADARRGARFYPGRWALPHHRDMAPFIPLWNECRVGPLNMAPTRARARAKGPLFVEFPGFSPRPEPSGDVKECSHNVYRLPSQEVASVARHRRQRCASRRAPMGAVEGFYPGRWRYRTTTTWRLSFHCGMNAADTSAWRGPAPRDRRGVGRLPSRSALIWRTTRSRAGGAGAIETPTPGAVPGCCPGHWALPHHRDMAPFIPQWNECRRHFGLAGHTYRLRIGTSA